MAHVRAILKETALDLRCLEFKLTETAFMQDTESTVAAKLSFDKAAVPRSNRRELILRGMHIRQGRGAA